MAAHKEILVFKIGTASVTQTDGSPDEGLLKEIARQIAGLHNRYHIVIVSSGAVGTGKKFINHYSGKIEERKAAAAIGNPILIQMYANAFAPYRIPIAQSLCERHHFSHRDQFLQLRETYHELWKNGVIPIANENDVVSNRELKFSDNDELATRLAIGLGASLMLIATSVPGVLDENDRVVREIRDFSEATMLLARNEKSVAGLGGMSSKLTFARLATNLGTRVVIFGARTPDGLILAEQGAIGTVCLPRKVSASSRQKWLAAGSLVIGRLQVDEGARAALLERKSLLSVGVKKIEVPFAAGEVVELTGPDGEPFAIAKAKVDAARVQTGNGAEKLTVAHADEIVLL
jgi:glutamate 5-kinase